MVYILYLHKLDMSKCLKAPSAAMPCNLPTVLPIKSPYLWRQNQNNGPKAKVAVKVLMIKPKAFTEVIPWNQRLELCSNGESHHYTATVRKGLRWDFLMSEELKQHWGWQAMGRWCQRQLWKPKAAVSTCWTESYRVFFLVQITNHWLRFQRHRISNSGSTKRQEFATPVPSWGLW